VTILYDAKLLGPATHVLAIGVGKYPHLIGGNSKDKAVQQYGLGQLKSPPVSAKRFIDWCLGPLVDPPAIGYENDKSPLGSVEALISAKAPVSIQTPGGAVTVDGATGDAAFTAFMSWWNRVQQHPENIGAFYACGHGVEISDDYLLFEDFGNPAKKPWVNAVSIMREFLAASNLFSGTLYFFLDSCRDVPQHVRETLKPGAPNFLETDSTKRNARSATLIWSTPPGHQASAPSNGGVSYFTEALVTALSGYCGNSQHGIQEWLVDHARLLAAVNTLLEAQYQPEPREVEDEKYCDAVGGGRVPLVRLRHPPKVKVELSLKPKERRPDYRFYLKPLKGKRYKDDPGFPAVYHTEVLPGSYEVGADPFKAGVSAIDPLTDQLILPPLYRPPALVAAL
jgi:hypothetical protein